MYFCTYGSDVTEAQISQANSDTHTLGIVSMSPSVNDDLLLTSSMDGSVALWQWSDRALSRLARREHVRDVQVDGVAFNVDVWASALHPLGTNFAVAGEGAHVYLLSTDMATFGEGIRRLPVDDVEPNSYALSLAFVRVHSTYKRIMKVICSLWVRIQALYVLALLISGLCVACRRRHVACTYCRSCRAHSYVELFPT